MSDSFKYLRKPPGSQIPFIWVLKGPAFPNLTLQLGDLGQVILPLRKLEGFLISTTRSVEEDTSCYA